MALLIEDLLKASLLDQLVLNDLGFSVKELL